MEPRHEKEMSITDYHSHLDFDSKTMLSEFADCPARYEYYYIKGGKKKETDALRIGNAVHVMALEPELWKANYHVLPETYFNDKGVENAWKQDARMSVVQDEMLKAGYEIETIGKKVTFKKTAKSKVVLKKDELIQIEGMAESLTRNAYALSLLKRPGYVESSIFWENENGQKMRCRPDFMANDGLIVDIKKCRSVNPDIFFKDAFNYGYHLSPAITWEGYEALFGKEPDNYVFVCVEETAPYFVECFEVLTPLDNITGMTYLDYGKIQLKEILSKLAECRTNNVWPQYQNKIGGMKLPGWEMARLTKQGDQS